MKPRNDLDRKITLSAAQFLKRKRLELGLTQEEVAKTLGIKSETVCMIEKGKCRLTLTNFVRFAHRYAPEIKEVLPKELSKSLYIMLTSKKALYVTVTFNETPLKHPRPHI